MYVGNRNVLHVQQQQTSQTLDCISWCWTHGLSFPAASTNTTLTVVTHPTDSDSFPVDNHTAVTIGNTQVLRCVGSGSSSPPSIVWVRNGEQLVNGGRITITEGTNSFSRQSTSELTITNFALSDAGVYQCIFTEGAEVITTTALRLDTGQYIIHTFMLLDASVFKILYLGITIGSHIY